jgi:hypothetical protein
VLSTGSSLQSALSEDLGSRPPFAAANGHATIGRFELRREIGRGTMGVVWEAHDPLLGRMLAIKTICIAFAVSPEQYLGFEQRFLAEARIAAGLSHPGIVVVHDVGQDERTGALYIAMEYLEGCTLQEILRPGAPLPWREALRITRQVAHAVNHAHAHGVVHRDIKPANVMLLASGEPKIMDFGIARAQAGGAHLTAAGFSIGTPLYVSPELALGQAVDGRSDLFSLGAVAYSLLTGRPAFEAESIAGVVSRVIASDPAPPSSVVHGVPAAVDRVIARALAKAPADRYADGAALCAELDAILADSALPDPPEPVIVSSIDGAADTLPDAVSSGGTAPQRVRRGGGSPATARPRELKAALVVLAAVALVGAWPAMRPDRWAAPAPPTATGAPPRVPTTPTLQAPTAQERARLAIGLDRMPRDARVRVWVDRSLVAEQRAQPGGDSKPELLRFGAEGARQLDLAPGGHDTEVEVAWNGKRLRSRIWCSFRAGTTQQLRVTIKGFLKKDLSLERE